MADTNRARDLSRYFKAGPGGYAEGDEFIGVRVPDLRRIARAYCALPERDVGVLVRSRFHEERLLGLLILVKQFQRGDQGERKRVYSLYRASFPYVNNWDLVDLSAPHIVGGHFLNRSRGPLVRFSRSSSVWVRRISIVATLAFIREDDFETTLNIAKEVLDDTHHLIQKAAGWMLREVGKRDRDTLERFLEEHHAAMPRTMLRYAIERFPEPLRKAYLKGTFQPVGRKASDTRSNEL